MPKQSASLPISPSPSLIASYKKYRLIFKKPAGTSRGALYHRDTYFLILRDRAEPDRFGLGECGPLPGLSLDDRPAFEMKLAEVCRWVNEGGLAATLALMNQLDPVAGTFRPTWEAVKSRSKNRLARFPALAFGLEMALLDWYKGGIRQLFDTGFSRGQAVLPTHGLIWMGSPAELLAQIETKVAQGYTCLKMKVGALDFETECRLLAEIRHNYPPEQIELRLDANGAFNPMEALAKLETLARFDIFAIEQPLKPGQWPKMAEVCRHSPIPIALDEELIGVQVEAQRVALLETIRPHYLVLKPTLLGGFAAAEAWLKLAQRLGMGWWANSMLESNVGLSALSQWASTFEPSLIHGLGTGQLYTNNIPSPLRIEGAGLWSNPDGEWDLTGIF